MIVPSIQTKKRPSATAPARLIPRMLFTAAQISCGFCPLKQNRSVNTITAKNSSVSQKCFFRPPAGVSFFRTFIFLSILQARSAPKHVRAMTALLRMQHEHPSIHRRTRPPVTTRASKFRCRCSSYRAARLRSHDRCAALHQLCQCPLEYKCSGTAVFSQLFIHIPRRDKGKRLLPFLQADLLGYTRQPRRTGVVIFLVKGDSS